MQMAGSVIVAGARTPVGKLSGALSGFSAAELGGLAITGALHEDGLSDAAGRLRGIKGLTFVRLDRGDIARHKLVQRIVEAYGPRGPSDRLDESLPQVVPDELDQQP